MSRRYLPTAALEPATLVQTVTLVLPLATSQE